MDDIIKTLAGQLGLSTEQAAGGAGAVINMIRDGIDANDFKKLATMVPEISGWMKAAPTAGDAGAGGGGILGQAGDLLGSLAGGAGGGAAGGVLGSLGGLAGLVGALGKLGIDPETAAKFVPTLLQFLQSKAGADLVAKILANVPALKNLGGAGGGGDLAGMLGGLFR
ncbi:MAG TPA: DUF2780 domain-containing protein [Thermoanaerobaculia bacterium]|nr:DUF2780 domain-containing protein [Thermoanaerobaculia bacterium]